MKTTIISIVLAAVVLLLASCAAPKPYLSFLDWDANHTGSIERQEFVQTYTAQGYFKKWSSKKRSISYAEMQRRIFTSLDRDKNLQLDKAEFDGKIEPFYFRLFHNRFENWDDSCDGSISQAEFGKHIASSSLWSIWDTNSDKVISELEMAGGMFYVCDFNGDTRVANLEFEKWRVNR